MAYFTWSDKYKLSRAGSVFLLLVLLTAYTIYHWRLWGVEAAPPGSDGGNWLAFAYLLAGESVKATTAAYPPAFPWLLNISLHFLPPLVALKALGLVSAACVSIPAYFLLRTAVNPWFSAIIAAAIVGTGYHNNILAWGGYPQLLGVAFLLLTVYLFRQGLVTGKVWFLAASVLTTVLTVATHTLAAINLALALGVLAVVCFYGCQGNPSAVSRRRMVQLLLMWIAVTGVLLLPVVPNYIRALSLLAGNPLNPQQFDLLAVFAAFISWHNESYTWLALGIIGGTLTAWMVLARRCLCLADVVTAIVASSLLTFVLVREMRSVHLIQVGVLLSVGVVITFLDKEAAASLVRVSRQTLRYLAVIFVVTVLSAVLLFGEQRSQSSFAWYRVVDSQVLASLDWLKENGSPGDVVVAGESPRGNILGWWVEGYANLPTYLAVDPRWLAFHEEREQSEIAYRFISSNSDPAELCRLAQEYGIRFLFLHREMINSPLPKLTEAGFTIGFINESTIVWRFMEKPPK